MRKCGGPVLHAAVALLPLPGGSATARRVRKPASGCRRARWTILAPVVLGLLAGCATAPKAPEEINLFWPPPPDTARIRLVRVISVPSDIQEEKPDWKATLEYALYGKRNVESRMDEPLGVAVSDDGERAYVTDYARAVIHRIDFRQRTMATLGQEALQRPAGIALDGEERLYVAEPDQRRLTVLDREGQVVRRLEDPALERPVGVAVDRVRRRLYVADASRQRSPNHVVRRYGLDDLEPLGTIGLGKGSGEGALLFPTFLALDADGNLYVADTMNGRVQVFDPDGGYVRAVGSRGNVPGTFSKPKGLALDTFGNLYVSDTEWGYVQIFNREGQALMVFGGRGRFPGLMQNPAGVAIDGRNRIYVADNLNKRLNVYQLVNTTAEDSRADTAGLAPGKEPERSVGTTEAGPKPATRSP